MIYPINKQRLGLLIAASVLLNQSDVKVEMISLLVAKLGVWAFRHDVLQANPLAKLGYAQRKPPESYFSSG